MDNPKLKYIEKISHPNIGPYLKPKAKINNEGKASSFDPTKGSKTKKI